MKRQPAAGSRPESARQARSLRFGAATACLLTASLFASAGAHASGVISFGNNKSISIGLGMRGSYDYVAKGAPNGGDSSSFSLDSVRLYISGQVTPWLKATFNTERDGDGHIDVLDGYIQFEPSPEFNVWIGRMLPPSDRANLDGPYYLNTWAYPGIVSRYPAKFAGRDDGATVWGKLFGKKLVYSVGVFNGHNRITGASNGGDNMLYAGRIAINFLDPEPDPAYYESSTYYGSANILTLAFATQYQANGVGTAATKGDFFAWNVDALFEKKYSFGTPTLEGAYYEYNTDSVVDVPTNFGGAGPTDNVGGITQGKAYLIGADYMFPSKVGVGYVQPAARYQEFDPDLPSMSVSRQYDFGVNYVIDGHNARLSADYFKTMYGSSSYDGFMLGVQVQI